MASCGPLHTCELCGQEGLSEGEMRTHMKIEHVEGSPACPFCDLMELTSSEMEIHVNSAHLDFLTPESDDLQYLEGGGEDYGSLWELDKCAGEEGLTGGMGESPGEEEGRVTASTSSPNPFVDSEDEDDTEEDTTVCSVVERLPRGEPPKVSLLPHSSPSSPRKRARAEEPPGHSPSHRRDKSLLTLPLRRPTGGCSVSTSSINKDVSTLHCPMCPYTDSNSARLQEHVNRAHLDELSPAPGQQQQQHACPLCSSSFPNATLLQSHFTCSHPDLSPGTTVSTSPSCDPSVCPVCGDTGWSPQQLQLHVESHFEAASTSTVDDRESEILAQELETKERAKRKREEEAQFASLQAQYGMDEQGNFTSQSVSGLRKAVVSGQLSVVDFYERSAGFAESQRSGVDDGTSMTPKMTSIIRGLSQGSSGVKETLLSSRTDHYASTFGDKGWGCGFRNLQMVLSCLLHSTQYRDTVLGGILGNRNLGGRMGPGMPSLPRLQKVIEDAWRAGFDKAGCEQLGGRLVNSRKWIGATEIATFLSYCNVDTEIFDFHAPSSPDGTHPRLFEWVIAYFRKGGPVTPPLYLQHQGHSRTIVGAEVLTGGGAKLLILDPSHSPSSLSENTMRMVRKTLGSMRSKQYQVVAVVGRLDSAPEREAKKVISSRRIPE